MQKTVIIGWGNDFHRDDGAGRVAATHLRSKQWPNVEVYDFNQLAPEHAELVAGAARVIFVDAYPAAVGAEALLLPLFGQEIIQLRPSCFGHAVQPTEVASLAEQLYGASFDAWLAAIPGVDFELGEGLSETARRGVLEIVEKISALLLSRTSEEISHAGVGNRTGRPAH